MKSLDQILDLLNQYHQRATYGAVAELIRVPTRSLMSGRPRDWRHSWVVNKETKQPTKYSPEQVHPAIDERQEVLNSGTRLEAWLRDPR
jgi:hypothetical protein